jgi:hypothetical protein
MIKIYCLVLALFAGMFVYGQNRGPKEEKEIEGLTVEWNLIHSRTQTFPSSGISPLSLKVI